MVFRILFAILAIGFTAGGIGTLLGIPFYVAVMKKVGVDKTLSAVIALLEIAAGTGLVAGLFFPALGAAAAAGLALLMIGAVIFHIRSKDYNGLVAPILLGLMSAAAIAATAANL
ncbi:DoxX family protein [Dactylosporangium sp. NPDC050588]|uniref:DoxX family protein n=1 Tax=Dactylosporangium sp. NPDC050588 TaxID=3157211 RepID=UPI003406E63C